MPVCRQKVWMITYSISKVFLIILIIIEISIHLTIIVKCNSVINIIIIIIINIIINFIVYYSLHKVECKMIVFFGRNAKFGFTRSRLARNRVMGERCGDEVVGRGPGEGKWGGNKITQLVHKYDILLLL